MAPTSKKKLSLLRESQTENLFTKEQGQHIYERIRQELLDLPSPGLLVLDFRKIQHITLPCLRQILAIFQEYDSSAFAKKSLLIKLHDANSDLKESFSLVAKEESLVLLCCDVEGNWEILGHLTHALRVTLEMVQKLGRATSEQVSEALGLRLSAASNRLRQLYRLGRQRGGKLTHDGRKTVCLFVCAFTPLSGMTDSRPFDFGFRKSAIDRGRRFLASL